MLNEPIDQFRRRCKKSTEKWALLSSEEKIKICLDIKKGFPEGHPESLKIERQVEKL